MGKLGFAAEPKLINQHHSRQLTSHHTIARIRVCTPHQSVKLGLRPTLEYEVRVGGLLLSTRVRVRVGVGGKLGLVGCTIA